MAQTIISSWKQSFLGDPSTIFYGKDQRTGKLQIWVKKTLPMVGCSVQSGTLLLLGSIMSWHTCRIHILLDAAVRCMLLHMRLLGVNYVVNDPCCFSSVMNSLTCFSESVEVPLHCTTCRRTFWFHSLADNVLWCSGRCMLAAFTRGKLPHLSILAGFL